ncbi:MAG: hypothetical protein ACT4OE_01845 [Sphingosinicella sp.]
MTESDPLTEEIRRRQRARVRVTAALLAAFVILLYFITIARIGGQ